MTSETAKPKVLIVDDSPTMRALIKVDLVHLDVTFLEACDGVEGLEIARHECPAVIISDLKMP